MTPAQKAALEGLVERPLTADEVTQIDALLPNRNDVAIAGVLSVGRKVLQPRMISQRGVRTALPIVQAVEFLTLLRETANANAIPSWLTDVLSKVGVPSDQYFAYFDTVGCAHGWLQGDGIDLGAETTRDMLDVIAASDPKKFGASVATLKALAQGDNPIPYDKVSRVLNIAEGRMVL